ncbi:putative component of NuA3 histone acetyltransferase complex [Coemansia sp. RSA 1836]|nr:putative component of NuA3 histone acetyltransferase complex [Coemansia sp. RSA 1836]
MSDHGGEQPVEKRHRSDNGPTTTTSVPVTIHPWYLSPSFTTPFRQAFTDRTLSTSYTSSNMGEEEEGEEGGNGDQRGTILAYPFHTGKLHNIFPASFLHSLKAELHNTLTWHERSNDLYTFYQTDDLALNAQPHIKALRDYMAGEQFVSFMESLTGVQLTRGYLDIAAQRYKRGNHLLCHDDDVQRGKLTRRIAYIIYLVDEQWSSDDGGALGLFGNNRDGQPTEEVVARLTPEFNSLGFFLTGLVSYHTVEEVTVADPARERWSVTGWFYGPVDTEPATDDNDHESLIHGRHHHHHHQPLSPSLLPAMMPLADTTCVDDSVEWAKWISADYLGQKTQDQIQDSFLNQSSVELRQFLVPAIFDKVIEEFSRLSADDLVLLGPPHLRRYLQATTITAATESTRVLYALMEFLRSASFARLITALTSIDVTAVSQQLRRFDRGHYTLIHDQVPEPFGLDVTLSLQPKEQHIEWDGDLWGGATHYIADKDELLRITPESNSLSLVLRDEGTLRFVKYLNHMAPVSRQEVAMVFTIAPSESEDDDNNDDE